MPKCMYVTIYNYVLVKPTMSRISLILHETEEKPRPSVNIKDILQMQVGFNCLLSHKGIIPLMLQLTYKGFNRLLAILIPNTTASYTITYTNNSLNIISIPILTVHNTLTDLLEYINLFHSQSQWQYKANIWEMFILGLTLPYI